jgi:hypothetical protein
MSAVTEQHDQPSFGALAGRLAKVAVVLTGLWLVVGYSYSIPFSMGYAAPLLAALLGVTIGAYCHFRSKAYREIHVDDQALRVVTRTGESLQIAWSDVLRANHLDNMGVWFRWEIVSHAGVEIRIPEAGLSRQQWWSLFHKISDRLPRASELPWSESK